MTLDNFSHPLSDDQIAQLQALLVQVLLGAPVEREVEVHVQGESDQLPGSAQCGVTARG